MIFNLGKEFEKISTINSSNKAIIINKNKSYSYLELDILSNKFCNYFKTLNLKKNNIIAIESEKNIYSYSIIIACLKYGLVYCFINVNEAPFRRNQILKKINAKFFFTFKKKRISTNILISDKFKIKIKKYSKKYIITNDLRYNLNAYIMFTSGSTGEPKGVVISHKNLFYFIRWIKEDLKINKKYTITNLNPLHFDNSVFDIYSSFFTGSSLVAFDNKEYFQIENFFQKIRETKCNLWFSVPSLLNLLIHIGGSKNFKNLNLKKIIFGGEKFPKESVSKIYKLIPNTNIYNVSGPTECTCICSLYKIKKNDLQKYENIPIGHINKYFKYLIINKYKKNTGELVLGGPAVSNGYINDPKKTKNKFYFKNKKLFYKTGDLVEFKNRKFFIIGRVDNQIKFLGHRIELEEIERSISNNIPGILNVIVILKNKKIYPYKKLVAYCICKNNMENHKIKLNLIKYLPKYMIPEEFNQINSFILNKNSKIDRNYYMNIK